MVTPKFVKLKNFLSSRNLRMMNISAYDGHNGDRFFVQFVKTPLQSGFWFTYEEI